MIHVDMNLENRVLLRRIPQECSMDKGKEHDVNDWLRRSNISQRLM